MTDNRIEWAENNSGAHTYMLELSKNILRDTKLVEFWLDGMDDIVYHSTVYGRLNETLVLTPLQLLQIADR
jgi:hypothetical protein